MELNMLKGFPIFQFEQQSKPVVCLVYIIKDIARIPIKWGLKYNIVNIHVYVYVYLETYT